MCLTSNCAIVVGHVQGLIHLVEALLVTRQFVGYTVDRARDPAPIIKRLLLPY